MVNALIPWTRLDQMLEGFFGPARPADSNGEQVVLVPRTDMLEGEKDFLVRMELPGVSREDLSIHLENQVLTVEARRQHEIPAGYSACRRELPGQLVFRRSFEVGRGVDGEGIKARLEEGVLTLRLPKSEAAMPRRIEVQ
jgi:HSP20 family protein